MVALHIILLIMTLSTSKQSKIHCVSNDKKACRNCPLIVQAAWLLLLQALAASGVGLRGSRRQKKNLVSLIAAPAAQLPAWYPRRSRFFTGYARTLTLEGLEIGATLMGEAVRGSCLSCRAENHPQQARPFLGLHVRGRDE